MGFSKQEYWSGLPCSPPGESSLPRDQTHVSHMAGRFFIAEALGKPILTLGKADLGCKTDCWGRRGAFWLQAERPPALHSPVYSRPRAATTLSPSESVAPAAPRHGSWLSLWETRESHQLGTGATPGPPSCGLEIPPGVCQRRWALRG